MENTSGAVVDPTSAGAEVLYQVSSSIFILHMSNFTWTQGPDAGVANSRAGHACATYGDSFVVWGGKFHVLLLLNEKRTESQLLDN